jgi:hypothetical protein
MMFVYCSVAGRTHRSRVAYHPPVAKQLMRTLRQEGFQAWVKEVLR